MRRNAQPQRFFAAVEITLDHICEGGIYDHLGGGFARYSVDERWLVPHFEKMLYDNAQLLELLALAWARTGKPLYRERAAETVGWLAREMTTGEGAFAASLDADSEGEEGKFYVWSHAEIVAALGPDDAGFFSQNYDVTPEGNFESHNILNRLKHLRPDTVSASAADQANSMLHPDRNMDGETRLAALRQKLLMLRGSRVRPGLDDKVLADWNGLMIAALVNAGMVFGEPSWLAMARRAFDFIGRAMTRGDRLGHCWREGRLLFPGLASDFAAMVKAALALNEATGEGAYLDSALAWQRALDRHYAHPAGGYYLTADDAEGLVVRPAATTDDATPNHNAIIAQNLVRLSVLAGDDHWRAAADRIFDRLLPLAAENLFMHVALLNALDLRLRAAEIVVTGRDIDAFAAAALKLPFVDRIVRRARDPAAISPSHAAFRALANAPETAAFVCVGDKCSLPLASADAIADAVARMRGTS